MHGANLLDQIKDEAEGLDDMVRNLLAITRIDAGALELRLDWVDLRDIAGRVVSRAKRHGAVQHFTTRIPENLPLVRADATLVEQALNNIVRNAVAHTPPDTRIADRSGNESGSPGTDDNRQRAWNFSNYSSACVREVHKGARQRGRWWSRNWTGPGDCQGNYGSPSRVDRGCSPTEQGRGTRITMIFPTRGCLGMSAKTRVLVVDDEPAIIRFLKPALEANDYDLTSTGTLADALKRIASSPPDIVVLDLGLPDGDGKDVIRQVRQWSDVPIIVLSARDRETEKIEALDLGADDFVNKPFGVGELLGAHARRASASNAAKCRNSGGSRRTAGNRQCTSPRPAQWAGSQVDAQGIRTPIVPVASCREGTDASSDHDGSVGAGTHRGYAIPACLCRPSAPEA